MDYDVIVVGGGAAGLMAACTAAERGKHVLLLEKMDQAGRKLRITGKGRCNLTNDCDTDEFMAQVPRNPRFLYSALNFFSPQDMMSLLESAGCPVQVQRGRRVFPVSEKASDVTRALQSCLRNAGVTVRLGAGVQSLESEGGRLSGVRLEDGSLVPARAASATRLPVPPGTDTVLRKKRATQWSPGLRSWSVWRQKKPGPACCRGSACATSH